MPLGWSEIRARAIAFTREWRDVASEAAEKQSYWNDFFAVFGKKRRAVAAFEEPVRKLSGSWGRIDLFWPGTLLVEHKSAGEDLGKAHSQGLEYIRGLVDSGRENEAPRYLIVSDFQRIALHDLEPEEDPDLPLFKRLPPTIEFPLADLPKHVHAFGFLAGYRTFRLKEEDPANIEAAELLAELHDVLEEGGYPPHEVDRFLVRILFCLFAEDTGIFEANPRAFTEFLQHHTAEDGSDLGDKIERLFRVMDTPPEERAASLPEHLAEFPYVNGRLFAERLAFADFTRPMRDQLLACAGFNWSRISPAVFGSLFQSIMAPRERRQIGAHYTTERDILKLLRSLFLDDLHAEFAQIRADRSGRRDGRLAAFQRKLAGIKILDPACGCGNFLILAYRELRRLETQTLSLLRVTDQAEMDFESVARLAQVDVDQLHGIEIGEWPARIAEVAIWLMDHLCNQELSAAFGVLYRRLPLKKSANIAVANALRLDWNEVLPAAQCTYVLGNPPFVGHHYQDAEQKADQQLVMSDIAARGVLDFVANWYVKAIDYLGGNPAARCAFVSTNSITQGEQAGILWSYLLSRGAIIHFAHRTFSWMSEARGRAHVHVVIIGFGLSDWPTKHLTDYEGDPDHPHTLPAARISPYLVEGPPLVMTNRSEPLCVVPRMRWGNKPTDGGHLIFSAEEKTAFLAEEPGAAEFIRPYMSGGDFINGVIRYCLWLKDAPPAKLRALPLVRERIERVRQSRLESSAATTRAYAAYPTLFRQIAQPDSDYLAVPEVSSERRPYIPIAFLTRDVICSNKIQFVPEATPYHFGILTSRMHMAWMRQVCGRLKSDYSYSNTLVYNNYPWPTEATEVQRAKVAECAEAVLAAREPYLAVGQTLADLYDPLAMPADLLRAHLALDRAVERAYRREPFESDRQRVEYLFALYERLAAPLLPATPRRRRAIREEG